MAISMQKNDKNPKAVVIVSEGRSGTNYLASRLNSLGTVGRVDEWLDMRPDPKYFAGDEEAFEAFYRQVVERGSTQNGNFGIKIFPRHLFHVQRRYSIDFVERLSNDFDIVCLFIERRDRVMQAISFSRALQTGKWKSTDESTKKEIYDFNHILRAYYNIGESYTFWRSYLALSPLETHHFYYEDMLQNDSVFEILSSHFKCNITNLPSSPLKIQRDEISRKFREKFERDLLERNKLEAHRFMRPPRRSLRNLVRFIIGKLVKPYPYSY